MGGTQDNGTFETSADNVAWPQIIYGDGGQSGWNATTGKMRFNSFFGQFHDANFHNGDPTKWVIIGGADRVEPGGLELLRRRSSPTRIRRQRTRSTRALRSVWRTKDWGGDPTFLEATCPEFFVLGCRSELR